MIGERYIDKLRTMIINEAIWAETNLKGKTGKEKKAAVVQRIDDAIHLPDWLEWLDGPIISVLADFLIDKIVWLLNLLTEHDFFGLKLSVDDIKKLSSIAGADTGKIEEVAGETVSEKIESLATLLKKK